MADLTIDSAVTKQEVKGEYLQEQRQLNMMLGNLKDVIKTANKFSGSAKEFSQGLTTELQQTVDYLQQIQQLMKEIKSINIDDYLSSFKNKQAEVDKRLSDAVRLYANTQQLVEGIKETTDFSNNPKLKEQFEGLYSKIVSKALDSNSIFAISEHVTKIGNSINDLGNQLKDNLVGQFGQAFGNDLIPSALTRITQAPFSAEEDITKFNLLNDQLKNELIEAKRIVEQGNYTVANLKLINDRAISKLQDLESNGLTLLSSIDTMKESLANFNANDIGTSLKNFNMINSNIFDIVTTLHEFIDGNDEVDESDAEKVRNVIDGYFSLNNKTNILMKSLLSDGKTVDTQDIINDLNKISDAFVANYDLYAELQQKSQIVVLEKRANALKSQFSYATKEKADGTYEEDGLTKQVGINALLHYNTVGDSTLNDRIFSSMMLRPHLNNNEREFARDNANLSKHISYGNDVMSDLSNDLRNLNKSEDLDIHLKRAGQVGNDIASQQIKIFDKADLSAGKYSMLSSQERQDVEDMKNSAKQSLDFVTKIISAYELLGKSDDALSALKEHQKELIRITTNVDLIKEGSHAIGDIWTSIRDKKNFIVNGMRTGFAALGIGAILNPLQMLETVKERMMENGKMRYNLSATDASMGLGINTALNKDLYYNEGRKIFALTNGDTDFTAPTELYQGFVKNVGGQYGGSNVAARQDLHSMTKDLIYDKVLYDIPDNDMQDFLKNFYKDLNNSASETVGKFRQLEGFAKASNVPIETLLRTVNQMVSSLRDVGVEGDVVLRSVSSLTGYHGLRLEDASEIVQQTAGAADKMSKDWGRSIFWGMMSGEEGSPFDMVARTTISHHADGSVNKDYYDTLVKRLFTESSFFGDRWGGVNTPEGQFDMQRQLKEQGYTQAQSANVIRLAKQGNIEELKQKLQDYDKVNDTNAPAETTQDLINQLQVSSNQMAETQKYKAHYTLAMNDIAEIIDTKLGSQLHRAAEWLGKEIELFGKEIEKVIKSIGGFLNSPTGKALTDLFVAHPFMAIGGLIATGALAKRGLITAAKYPFKVFGTKNTAYSKNKLAATAILAGGAIAGGALAAYNDSAQSQAANETTGSGDWWGKTAELLANGNAKITIVTGSAESRNEASLKDKIIWAASLVGLPLLALKYYRFKKGLNVQRPQHPGKSPEAKRSHKPRKVNPKRDKKRRRQYNKAMNDYRRKMKDYKEKADKTRKDVANRRKYGRVKQLGGNFLSNFAWMFGTDMLYGDPDEDMTQRIKEDAISSGAGAVAETGLEIGLSMLPYGGKIMKAAKFILPSMGGMAASSLAGQAMSGDETDEEKQEEILHQKAQRMGMNFPSPEDFENHALTLENFAESMGLSNAQFVQMMSTSLAAHGMKLTDVNEFEQRLWMTKFQEYMEIFNDEAKALNLASQALANINLAIRNLKSKSGADLSGAQLVKAADGSWTLDDEHKQKLYNQVAEAWNNSDETKQKWYERRSKEYEDAGDDAKSSEADYIAKYYKYKDLDPDSEEWQAIANDLKYNIAQGAEGRGDAKQNMWNQWYNKLYNIGDSSVNKHGGNGFGGYENIDAVYIKRMLQYAAETRHNAEYKDYYETVGNEDLQDAIKQIQSGATPIVGGGNVSPSGAVDKSIMKNSRSWDDTENTDWTRLRPEAVGGLNAFAKAYADAHGGEQITLTGAAESGHGHQTQNSYSHVGGWKTDVVVSDTNWALDWLRGQGFSANFEGDHIDVDYSGNDNRSAHAKNPYTGFMGGEGYGSTGGGGGGANPTMPTALNAPKLDMSKIKNKTMLELKNEGLESYDKALSSLGGSGKLVKGRIVNGMYIDANQKYESVDDIKKRYEKENEELRKTMAATAKDTTAVDNHKAISQRIAADYEQHPEDYVKKNYKFKDIMQKVEELAGEYLKNPLITANVSYK